MNILIISLYFPPDMGGASNRAWNASIGLTARGHRVNVIAGFPHYPDGKVPRKYRRKPIMKEHIKGLEVYRVWVPSIITAGVAKRLLIYLSFMFSANFALPFLEKIDGIFYVSPFVSSFFLPGLLSKLIKKVPLILDCGDLWPHSAIDLGFLKNKWLIKVAWLTTYISYRIADGIAPINDTIGRRIVSEYEVAENKVRVVELGVDVSVFKPLPRNASLLGFKQSWNKFIVMYSGILGPAYDFETILKAAKILEACNDILFVIRGEGECRQVIINRIKELELSNIIMLGKVQTVKEVVNYLNLAHVFVLPLKNVKERETAIPSKVYEFLACEKPVICCAKGELANLIQRHGAGLAVDPSNYGALAQAILKLFKNHNLCTSIGKVALKLILKHFSSQEVGRKLEIFFFHLK